MSADLVIRNGTVIDGSGTPGFRADVAITDGVITEIGLDIARGARELDAEGALVTPGFVDPHTHYDGQATWDSELAPSSHHGVTTVAMGNCGVGFAPCAPDRHDWLIAMMEGVEDIPGTALHEGLTWEWETFPEYLDALEATPHTIDVATHLPHAALRGYVMGDAGAQTDAHPSARELERMATLLAEALAAGALGVTTSRTERHRTAAGATLGTLRADWPELHLLADGLRQDGRGVFQFISDMYRTNDDDYAASEHTLLRQLATTSGRPVSFTVQQDDAAPTRWLDQLTLAEELMSSGLDVRAQVAPRPIGVLLGLEATTNVFTPVRSYQRTAHLPLGERVRALSDPTLRAKIIEGHRALTTGEGTFDGYAFFAKFDEMFVLDDPATYDLNPARSIGARARALGVDPRELAYDLQLEREGTLLLYVPLFNFSDRTLDVVRRMITSPAALFGLSDAGAHCGQICDGSMPTTYLSLWARDGVDGTHLPTEFVINQLTRRPAEWFGWTDRGLLAPGLLADVNVIDLDALAVHAPAMVADLPAGGRRLLQEAQGYRWTIKRGEVTFADGVATGVLPGRLVRGTGVRG